MRIFRRLIGEIAHSALARRPAEIAGLSNLPLVVSVRVLSVQMIERADGRVRRWALLPRIGHESRRHHTRASLSSCPKR